MIRWDGDTPLGDAAAVAQLYRVSTRTVRRRCTPDRREPRTGAGTGHAMYDLHAVADQLADVVPREARSEAANRVRRALIRAQLHAGGLR